MLPPRDYPEPKSPAASSSQPGVKNDRVTVRGVLERNDSKKPITEAMIHTAVTNLYTAEESVTAENVNRVTAPAAPNALDSRQRVPESLRTLFRNVLQD